MMERSLLRLHLNSLSSFSWHNPTQDLTTILPYCLPGDTQEFFYILSHLLCLIIMRLLSLFIPHTFKPLKYPFLCILNTEMINWSIIETLGKITAYCMLECVVFEMKKVNLTMYSDLASKIHCKLLSDHW